MPYVFQILAQLLELQQGPVSGSYLALLAPIMMPVLWEQIGTARARASMPGADRHRS